MAHFEKDQSKVINAWAMYDWANSVYFLVMSTAVFPVYFMNYSPSQINILGFETSNASLYSYVVSLSYIIIAIMSPFLSGIADFGGRKKYFLKLFTIFGALACMVLFFYSGIPSYGWGITLFGLATIGCTGAIVFYNAYLPIIASKEKMDKVSAKGFAFGYIGSVLLLLFILFLIQKPAFFGLEEGSLPVRIGFVLVGLWWLGFAQITFRKLPEDKRVKNAKGLLKKGYDEVKSVYHKVRADKHLTRFLLSVLFYYSGVQTVIYLATIFAKEELQFTSTEMIIVVLLLQVVAIAGAYLFAYVSKIIGNKMALFVCVVGWIIVCLIAYFVSSKSIFYVISGLVGLVMGGIQPLSRSTFSKMIPKGEDDVTSYFSFFDVVSKASIVLGTFTFGLVNNITGSLRYSVLALVLFFVIGGVLLLGVNFASRKEVSPA